MTGKLKTKARCTTQLTITQGLWTPLSVTRVSLPQGVSEMDSFAQVFSVGATLCPLCKNVVLAESPLKALLTAHMCEVPGLMSSPCC